MHGRPFRRAAMAGALAVTGALLSGCVGIRDISTSQVDGIGPVDVSANVCVSETPGCPYGRGNSDQALGDGAGGQVLMGYRVPAGTGIPATLTVQGTAFARSPSYEAELQRLVPAPAGSVWAGFLSDPVTYAAATDAAGRVVTARFALPSAPGVAFRGPFRYRPVVGVRSFSDISPASRPVACGATPYQVQGDGDAIVVCIDAPTPAEVATDLQAPVNDASIVPGVTRAAALPGGLAAIPFTIPAGGLGAPPVQVQLSARTTLKGAAIAPSPATLVPSPNGEHQALVIVGVPASAKRGIHGVTLSLTVGGQVREATTRLVVGRRRAGTAARTLPPRRVRLDWRNDGRARFYNLQVFSGNRKVLSLFPSASQRVVRLRPGRYRMVVWTGLNRVPTRYVPRPLVNRVLTVKAAPRPRAAG